MKKWMFCDLIFIRLAYICLCRGIISDVHVLWVIQSLIEIDCFNCDTPNPFPRSATTRELSSLSGQCWANKHLALLTLIRVNFEPHITSNIIHYCVFGQQTTNHLKSKLNRITSILFGLHQNPIIGSSMPCVWSHNESFIW